MKHNKHKNYNKRCTKNLYKVLDIAKEEYNNYFQRIETLDVKIGLLMAFYGIIYSNVIDINNLRILFTEINVNKNITFLNILSLHINMFSILLFIITIILLIYNLISRDTRFVPISLFDAGVTDYTEEELAKNLLEITYKDSIKKNNEALDKKHKLFNISCVLLIINIILIIIKELLKI